jgi:hypothetical protein
LQRKGKPKLECGTKLVTVSCACAI